MALITPTTDLSRFLPNMMRTAPGETNLYDKISGYLSVAETWVELNVVGSLYYGEIAADAVSAEIYETTSRVVVTEALRRALPSLDLVWTANGFGIVNSQNIAPASADRVNRLARSLEDERDELINVLVKLLRVYFDGWNTSEVGQRFCSTLFPDFDVVREVGRKEGVAVFDQYRELCRKIQEVEFEIANGWLSPELLKELHGFAVNPDYVAAVSYYDHLMNIVKPQIVNVLKGGWLNRIALSDIVQFIKNNPEVFPEWHGSATAKLFTPPVFTNSKDSSGFWF